MRIVSPSPSPWGSSATSQALAARALVVAGPTESGHDERESGIWGYPAERLAGTALFRPRGPGRAESARAPQRDVPGKNCQDRAISPRRRL